MWIAGLGAAWAASSTSVCADVAARMRDPDTTPEAIAETVRKDPRPYDAGTLECLCVVGAPPEVHREARRHHLRDTTPVTAASWSIRTNDPLTSPAQQLSTLLAQRLEADSGRAVPFIVLPTRLRALPTWIDAPAWFSAIDAFEVPGSRVRSRGWLDEQGVGRLPSGSLPALVDDGTVPSFDLTTLVGTYDRVLWVDLDFADDPEGSAEANAGRFTWSLRALTGARPSPDLSTDAVVLQPVALPFVPSCGEPPPATVRRWRGRLAWPAGRIATTVIGAVTAAVFGGLATSEYVAFTDAPAGDPANPGRISRNVAFGTVGIAGGVASVLGVAIPGRAWRNR